MLMYAYVCLTAHSCIILCYILAGYDKVADGYAGYEGNKVGVVASGLGYTVYSGFYGLGFT